MKIYIMNLFTFIYASYKLLYAVNQRTSDINGS